MRTKIKEAADLIASATPSTSGCHISQQEYEAMAERVFEIFSAEEKPVDRADASPAAPELFEKGAFFIHNEHNVLGVIIDHRILDNSHGLENDVDEAEILWEDGRITKADSRWLQNAVRPLKGSGINKSKEDSEDLSCVHCGEHFHHHDKDSCEVSLGGKHVAEPKHQKKSLAACEHLLRRFLAAHEAEDQEFFNNCCSIAEEARSLLNVSLTAPEFGYPSKEPCAVYSGHKNNQSEPRFGYTVCEDHQNVNPTEINSLPGQAPVAFERPPCSNINEATTELNYAQSAQACESHAPNIEPGDDIAGIEDPEFRDYLSKFAIECVRCGGRALGITLEKRVGRCQKCARNVIVGKEKALAALKQLTNEERLEFFQQFCTSCGTITRNQRRKVSVSKRRGRRGSQLLLTQQAYVVVWNSAREKNE